MQKVVNNAISLTRGDTGKFNLKIRDEKGEPYEIQDKDTILFTVKKSTNDKQIIIQKSARSGVITIQPSETANLAYGNYVYDVELTKEDGTVQTVIPPKPFRLTEEVTF